MNQQEIDHKPDSNFVFKTITDKTENYVMKAYINGKTENFYHESKIKELESRCERLEKALVAAHGAYQNGHSAYSGACGICEALNQTAKERGE